MIQRFHAQHCITAPVGMMRYADDGEYVFHADHVVVVSRWAEALRAVHYSLSNDTITPAGLTINFPELKEFQVKAGAMLEQYDKEAASATSKT